MRFVHADPLVAAEVTAFTDKDGWEHALVVMKATYTLPENGAEPQALPPQPLAMKDEYTGEAGLSAPWYENDFASHKARCDVIFKAYAYAPGATSATSATSASRDTAGGASGDAAARVAEARAVKQLDVVAQVGSMAKALRVVGDRQWQKDILLTRHSEPQPFVRMPLHYGRAFGGCPSYEVDGQVLQDSYAPNPVGTGFSKRQEYATLQSMPLPNLEAPGRALSRPDENYPALALSPLARNFFPRYTFAGTYDDDWKNNTAPFLPQDFDARFFQCAPEDQQIAYPQGGEAVCLVNMTPGRPEVRFCLPKLGGKAVRVLAQDLTVTELTAVVDTLYFEPDEGRFSAVWRASMRLGHKGLHEVRMLIAGDICPLWLDAVKLGDVGCASCEDFAPHALPKGCPHKEGFPASRPETPEPRVVD